ncbi:MAG: NAD-dependent protein deacylase [candidate division Zixibacteria bacterium RBG_16_48_11]|nr:MAG: NAD-dependent protein deacylase [candidate division Zixibacteria bacterium RBG_16_48_11]
MQAVSTSGIQTFSPLLLSRLKYAKRVVALTGAGVSAESGISTFRDPDGLWANFKPEELATPEAFRKNPRMVWEWYAWRREKIKEVKPNPGHYALAEMEKLFPKFTLITQNVDGLHHLAGSKNILELHGNIHRNKCFKCEKIYPEALESDQIPPKCSCGGFLRPDVVWFGELLPEGIMEKSYELSQDCDLFFSIGTSAVVQPAASLPIYAKRSGAYVAEINPQPTEISYLADQTILAKSGEVLPLIVTLFTKS